MICPDKIGSDVTQFWQARYDSVQEFSRGESSHWELAGNFQGKIAAKLVICSEISQNSWREG